MPRTFPLLRPDRTFTPEADQPGQKDDAVKAGGEGPTIEAARRNASYHRISGSRAEHASNHQKATREGQDDT